MAFALVQSPTQVVTTATSISITTAATGAGNLVVVYVRLSSNADTCTSVTDNVGNTYVLGTAVDNTIRQYVAYGVQVTGGATSITANFSGATVAHRIGVDEFSGGASTNAAVYDTTTSGTGTTGTSLAASTLTPSATGNLIVSIGTCTPAKTWTAGSGYTLSSGTGSGLMRSQYKLSGGASETAPMTISSAGTAWIEIAVSFKPASSSTPNSGFFRFM